MTRDHQSLGEVFDAHTDAEFGTKDIPGDDADAARTARPIGAARHRRRASGAAARSKAPLQHADPEIESGAWKAWAS